MDFNKRLQQAIERGQKVSDVNDQARVSRALNEDELRKLYGDLRIQLSEHIEQCLRQLADHFPGFECRSVVGEEGWGAEMYRDDLGLGGAKSQPKTYYSRFYSKLLLVIKPFSSAHIVELAGKGSIRNKEVFSRNQYQKLPDVDVPVMIQTIDQWVLEYAEKYAAQA
ncbi:MAG: hypothetical protein JWN70_4538 [Planctomycetaceae bacterium]|nr:hypothetical protein [Planctomycetaceae bacterium]